MNLIEIGAIKIPPRQRKELKEADIASLSSSISEIGLLHAIILRQVEDGFELVAGERRLGAIRRLESPYRYNDSEVSPGFIPFTSVDTLSAPERFQVELEENLRRVDLTWQEKAKAIAELHKMRSAEAEARGDTQLISDTGAELASLRGEDASAKAGANDVSRSLLVAQHLSNPKVAAAPSLKKAANIISQEFEAIIRRDLNEVSGQVSRHIAIHGSCLELLPSLPSSHFNCIITDPPYGMGADSFGDVGPQHHYADDRDTAMRIAQCILSEGFRLTLPQAHLYMFCDIDQFSALREYADFAGWTPFRTPIIWHKSGGMGHDPWPNRGFRRSYETILYCDKGSKAYHEFSKDVIEVPGISSPIHPAAKPAELYARLMARSCMPGDIVLDPCCGTGPIFDAANRLNVTAVGIELDESYFNIADGKRFPEAS